MPGRVAYVLAVAVAMGGCLDEQTAAASEEILGMFGEDARLGMSRAEVRSRFEVTSDDSDPRYYRSLAEGVGAAYEFDRLRRLRRVQLSRPIDVTSRSWRTVEREWQCVFVVAAGSDSIRTVDIARGLGLRGEEFSRNSLRARLYTGGRWPGRDTVWQTLTVEVAGRRPSRSSQDPVPEILLDSVEVFSSLDAVSREKCLAIGEEN